MKERNRRGQFRATETTHYTKKMKDHFGTFTSESEEAFNEAALDKYDFTTCQRGDGSLYGTGGNCRKGTETTKQEPEKKGKASGGGGGGSTSSSKSSGGGGGSESRALSDAKADLASAKSDLKRKDLTSAERARATTHLKQAERDVKKASGGGGADKAAAKTKKSSPAQEARESKDPKVQQRQVKNDIKKLSDEYERLRGKPEAAARRSEIMKEVSTLTNKQAALTKKIDDAAKSQSPAKAPDTSPAANQRRANAAARARD